MDSEVAKQAGKVAGLLWASSSEGISSARRAARPHSAQQLSTFSGGFGDRQSGHRDRPAPQQSHALPRVTSAGGVAASAHPYASSGGVRGQPSHAAIASGAAEYSTSAMQAVAQYYAMQQAASASYLGSNAAGGGKTAGGPSQDTVNQTQSQQQQSQQQLSPQQQQQQQQSQQLQQHLQQLQQQQQTQPSPFQHPSQQQQGRTSHGQQAANTPAQQQWLSPYQQQQQQQWPALAPYQPPPSFTVQNQQLHFSVPYQQQGSAPTPSPSSSAQIQGSQTSPATTTPQQQQQQQPTQQPQTQTFFTNGPLLTRQLSLLQAPPPPAVSLPTHSARPPTPGKRSASQSGPSETSIPDTAASDSSAARASTPCPGSTGEPGVPPVGTLLGGNAAAVFAATASPAALAAAAASGSGLAGSPRTRPVSAGGRALNRPPSSASSSSLSRASGGESGVCQWVGSMSKLRLGGRGGLYTIVLHLCTLGRSACICWRSSVV